MKKVLITTDRKYEILVDADWIVELKKIEAKHPKVLFVIPESIKSIVQKNISGDVFYTPDAEEQKNFATVEELWRRCGELNLGRDGAIIAIGGGATTDLAGFIAATWLRGISWYAFPTSLAGAVDASIGGKTGINSEYGKNLIGSFYSPEKVVVDLSFFETLSERDFNAGMAEVIKTGLIADPKILKLLDDPRNNLVELIYRSIKVKADVVSKDFKEGKLREILNYGHTLGHAIEKRESYKMRHGEAVAIGLVFAAELSALKLGLKPSDVAIHRDALGKFNLPISYAKSALNELLEIMRSDKKVRGSQMRFIGISKIGKVKWIEDVTEEEIRRAYERITE